MMLLINKTLQRLQSMLFLFALSASAFLTSQISAQAQSIEYVVFSIEGTIEGIALGQVLYEGNHFEIPKNASVNLIGKQGDVITLEGPVKATVTSEINDIVAEKTLAKISDGLFNSGKFVESVGGTRSSVGETDVKKILSVQADQKPWTPLLSGSDTYCVRSEKIVLQRQSAADELLLQLDEKSIKWKAGEHEFDLSQHLTNVAQSLNFDLKIENMNKQIFLYDTTQSTTAEQVAWLADKGCKKQAIMLLASHIKS